MVKVSLKLLSNTGKKREECDFKVTITAKNGKNKLKKDKFMIQIKPFLTISKISNLMQKYLLITKFTQIKKFKPNIK